MSNQSYTMPTKSDLILFVESFEDTTKKLKKEIPGFNNAFISFFGEGCFSTKSALNFIYDLDESETPESFCYAVRLCDQDEVVSIYVGRNDTGDKWVISHDNMCPVKDLYADNIADAYKEIKNSILKYLSI